MIQKERISQLNANYTQKGQFVLYWMQASQRAFFNHALHYAIEKANDLNQPLACLFVFYSRFPEANSRHFQFMMEGIQETKQTLHSLGIEFFIQQGNPVDIVSNACKKASCLITDRGYLRIQKAWRTEIANKIPCPLVQIESDIIVPVKTASLKEEYSAATIRKKIMGQGDYYLKPLDAIEIKKPSLKNLSDSLSLQEIYPQDLSNQEMPAITLRGGYSQAKSFLKNFIANKLNKYSLLRNDPTLDFTSGLSPYLHFGQISPVEIALEIKASGNPCAGDFLEQLMVRRELAINFTEYNPFYDTFQCLPHWAIQTLMSHIKDNRPSLYCLDHLEKAKTHDKYWNAAQTQMVLTGTMANYMRMYWGKKILEWSENPQIAYQNALYLNNKYQLDGRDPNSFAGIAWCFGKHDRPWQNRPIFGNIRYMNESGLKRKFDIDLYAEKYAPLLLNCP